MPIPDADSRPFWESTKKHELRIQRCTACRHYRFPPSIVCPECRSFEFDWALLSGKGTVYSWEIIHHQVMPHVFGSGPVAVVMVQQDEAETVRLVGNFVDNDGIKPTIGMPVEVVFEDQTDEISLVHWRPRT